MLKVYIGKILDNSTIVSVLYPNFSSSPKESWLFLKEAFKFFVKPVVEIVDHPHLADFLMIPHPFFNVNKINGYIDNFVEISKKYNKKIIIFVYSDSSENINLPNSVIFRTSQYRKKIQPNEIIMPAYTEDFLFNKEIECRIKTEKPTVGFCGWADLDFASNIKYELKNLLFSVKNKINDKDFPIVLNQGLFFRKKAIKLLLNCNKIKTNFIIRKTYSGHKKTISGPVDQFRKDYVSNLVSSDFILSVKGDGNYSYRFFEALSLGRIPLLIDTDCVLPLETTIDYSKFILSVSYDQLEKVGDLVFDYYTSLSPEDFIEKQKLARSAFVDYLRIDSFFNLMFLEKKIYNFIN